MLFDYLERLSTLMEHGGSVFIVILVFSVLMWTLIIERYWYIYLVHPARVRREIEVWQKGLERSSRNTRQIRLSILADFSLALSNHLLFIRALTTVLPLLGLLGTVMGMITSLEVMTVFGMDNSRGFSSGISQALLTTIAGLVTSISGLYFSAHLQRKAKAETETVAKLLVYD